MIFHFSCYVNFFCKLILVVHFCASTLHYLFWYILIQKRRKQNSFFIEHLWWVLLKMSVNRAVGSFFIFYSSPPQKTKFGPKCKWFKISFCNSFFENNISDIYNFFIFVQTFQWTSSGFFYDFRFSNRKSQSQQKLEKKITHFTIQFRSKNLIHCTNLNSLDIENNMLPKHRQKPFSLYKFSGMFLFGVNKKNLHCTISWRPRTAFLEHIESKCLYISVYLCKKILSDGVGGGWIIFLTRLAVRAS